MSGTIPPRPDLSQEPDAALFGALLKQLLRMNISIALLKDQLFAVASKIGSDPQIATKLRAAFEVDLELRLRETAFVAPVTWRELLELLQKTAAKDV